MSDFSQGPGWWKASDGKWYPPETAPQQPPRASSQPNAWNWGSPPPAAPAPEATAAESAAAQTAAQPVTAVQPATAAKTGPWRKFRSWPIAAQVVCWVVAFFVVVGGIGAAAGSGKKKNANLSVSSATTAASAPTTEPSTTAAPTTAPPTTAPPPTAPPTTAPPVTQPPAPTAAAAPFTLSGSGQEATRSFPLVGGGMTVLSAVCRGCQGNFSVEIDNSSGQMTDIPINTIGSYSGVVGEGLDAGSYILKVDADAPWTVSVTQPRSNSGAALPISYHGSGQAVVGPVNAPNQAVRIAATNVGQGNFSVEVFNADGSMGDIPINEIGNYNGSAISNGLGDGPYWVGITSDGNWTLNLSSP